MEKKFFEAEWKTALKFHSIYLERIKGLELNGKSQIVKVQGKLFKLPALCWKNL